MTVHAIDLKFRYIVFIIGTKLPAKFQLASLRGSGLKIDPKFWRQASKQAIKGGRRHYELI